MQPVQHEVEQTTEGLVQHGVATIQGEVLN
jgi:hypothetical protein